MVRRHEIRWLRGHLRISVSEERAEISRGSREQTRRGLCTAPEPRCRATLPLADAARAATGASRGAPRARGESAFETREAAEPHPNSGNILRRRPWERLCVQAAR